MAQRVIALALLLAASSATQAALAQPLADPTRPATAAPAESTPAEAATPPSRLQSVLISPSRRVAVIDGRAVKIGERVGDATLVAIAPSEVTLQRGEERQTLKLHAGIEKKPVPWRAAPKAAP